MKKHRWLLAFLTASLCAPSIATATDLFVKGFVAEWGTVYAAEAARFSIIIGNQNILGAETYSVRFSITEDGVATPEFEGEYDGPPIEPFTEEKLTIPIDWTPSPKLGLTYTLSATIDFEDEINPSNNTLTEKLTIKPSIGYFSLLHQQVEAPYTNTDRRHAALEYTYEGADTWRYLNVRALIEGNEWGWLLRNEPIPPATDSVTMVQPLDLSWVLTSDEQDTVRMAISIGADTLESDTSLHRYRDLGFKPVTYWMGGVQDTSTVSLDVSTASSTSIGGVPTSGLTIGCTMPNIDLNNTAYGPGSLADYAGDLNACAVAAAANSLQWLDDTWSDITPGQSHRAKLVELSRMMRRADTTGVWSEDFLRAKLEYINKYDLPIRVKFQRRGSTEDVESDDDYLSTAENKGNGGFPTFDWVEQEVADSEDVEMFVEYHKESGVGSQVEGRHVVVLTGAHKTTSGNKFWYKDDGDQRTAGGTQQRSVTWRTLPTGEPYFDPWKEADGTGHITVPYAIFSESRDTSVHRQGRGRLDRLGRFLYGVTVGKKSRVSTSIDHEASKSIRFGRFLSSSPSSPLAATVPVGGRLGERVTQIYRRSRFDLPDTASVIDGAIWYADTLQADTVQSAVSYDLLEILNNLDSSRNASITDGTESFTAPDSLVSLLRPIDGAFEVTDSVLSWVHLDPMDLDSVNYAAWYPDSLSDRGAQGEAAVASLLQALSSDTTFGLADTSIDLRVRLSNRTGRTREGTARRNLLTGSMRYARDNELPLRFEYQSLIIKDDSLTVDDVRIVAHNMTGPTGAPDLVYLSARLHQAPVIVEVGEYDGSQRTAGFYALCTGLLQYNGIAQLILDRDMAEGSTGGLYRTVQSVTVENDVLVIPELSGDGQRAVLEGVYSILFDPTVSSVGEDLTKEIGPISASPNPARDYVVIRADLYRSETARIQVVDFAGTVVATVDVSTIELANGVRLSMDAWSTGAYLVRVVTPHAHRHTMVVHQR